MDRLRVARGLRLSIYEASFGTIAMTLTTGVFLAGFAKYLGAGDFWMGVVAALPALGGLVQLPSAYYVEKRGERRNYVANLSGISRLLWILVALIPFLLPAPFRLPIFLSLLTLSCLLGSLPLPAFLSWLSDLVPADIRGRYFGRRNMICGVVGLIVAQIACFFVDKIGKPIGIPVVFALAALAGVASYVFLKRLPEPGMVVSERRPPYKEFLKIPFQDSNYRALMAYLVVWSFATGVNGNFFIVYMNSVLNLSYSAIALYGTIQGIAAMAATLIWGHLTDKYGNKPVMMVTAFLVIFLPCLWFFMSLTHATTTIILLTVNHVCAGIIWSGLMLSQFNMMIALSPPEGRQNYMASTNAVCGLAAGIAPVFGGLMMQAMHGFHFGRFGLDVTQYQILFLISSALRVCCFLIIPRVHEPDGSSARELMRAIGSPSTLGTVRHMRRLVKSTDEASRLHSIGALAKLENTLAVPELADALDDPSPAIREAAADALGRIGDEKAIEPLQKLLESPEPAVRDSAERALERLSDMGP